MIILKLRIDELISEEGVSYTAYGVDITYPDGRVESIPDISLSRERVEELVELCNSLRVSEEHFIDITEDFLLYQ